MYESDMSIKDKIKAVATKIYGAADVQYDAAAAKTIAEIEAMDPKYSTFPICMAKTQYSLSDDASKLGRPEGFTLTVREIKLSASFKPFPLLFNRRDGRHNRRERKR